MTTSRRPRIPIDDLADTLDEAEVARHRSGPIALTPAGEVADTDTEVDGWEQIRRFRAEVAKAHERADEAIATATNALTWNRRIVYALGVLAGVAGTALTFAFAVTRASGDAAGEKRERDAQRLRYIVVVDQLVRDVARHDGQLGSVLDALRTRYPIGAVPLLGPPNQDPP